MLEKPEIRPLNLEELSLAETGILKYVQCRNFQTELARVKKSNGHDAQGDKFSKRSVGKTTPQYKLDPVLKNQLFRVGGRLANAPISEEREHPIIVPKHSPISCLIARYYHRLAGHSGLEHVLSMIRERFWIVGAKNVLKKMLNSCVDCKRRQAPAGEQKMADLPCHRVIPDKPPFTFVGVDCFGPFVVKRARSLEKRYGIMFTCFAIRAVHIEVIRSLDTSSFLHALRRFIT